MVAWPWRTNGWRPLAGAEHALQVLTVEALAARLAGGFSRPIDDESPQGHAEERWNETDIGELAPIKSLPAMVDAAAETMRKAWAAGFALDGAGPGRVASLAKLRVAVVNMLPAGMMRPADLAKAATARAVHAGHVLGPTTFLGMADIPPCWRGSPRPWPDTCLSIGRRGRARCQTGCRRRVCRSSTGPARSRWSRSAPRRHLVTRCWRLSVGRGG